MGLFLVTSKIKHQGVWLLFLLLKFRHALLGGCPAKDHGHPPDVLEGCLQGTPHPGKNSKSLFTTTGTYHK